MKTLIVSHHGTSSMIRPIKSQPDVHTLYQRISGSDGGELWLDENTPYTAESKLDDISCIIIDWTSYSEYFSRQDITDIVSELQKLHPGILILQVGK